MVTVQNEYDHDHGIKYIVLLSGVWENISYIPTDPIESPSITLFPRVHLLVMKLPHLEPDQ